MNASDDVVSLLRALITAPGVESLTPQRIVVPVEDMLDALEIEDEELENKWQSIGQLVFEFSPREGRFVATSLFSQWLYIEEEDVYDVHFAPAFMDLVQRNFR
jgi:hypothetical protein